MKKIFFYAILMAMAISCKTKDPQPDWATKFVGRFASTFYSDYLGQNAYYRTIGSSNIYENFNSSNNSIVGTITIERVDNITLNLAILLVPYRNQLASPWHYDPIKPIIKGTFNNVKAINDSTLIANQSIKDSLGNVIFQVDTIRMTTISYLKEVTTLSLKTSRIQQINLDLSLDLYKDAVHELPTAFFLHGIQHKFVQNNRIFIALSNADKYQWDFGDGTTSTEIASIHEYKRNGVYTVSLKITDKAGKAFTDIAQVGVSNL